MMKTVTDAERYHQLGQLGVSWERVRKMERDLVTQADAQHRMHAQAKAPIIADDATETGKRLCYDSGEDGRDDRFWIEDIPDHHVDWEMTEAEWEEFRAHMWHGVVTEGSYVAKMRRSGALGPPVAP
jgi:hypothetical protein